MKTHPRHAIAILLPALLIVACSFSMPFSLPSLPGSKQAPAKITLHLAPDTLADPTLGLAELKSYHVSFRQDVTGTQDGKAYEHHTHIELTRASGDSDFVRDLQGTGRTASYFRAIQAGQAVYRWDSLQGSCQGEEGALRQNEILDPAELLLPVLKTTKVGKETINQISAIHYQFDQNALPITDPKPSATGDMWLAETGGYLVKYTLATKSNSAGLEGSLSWTYELSQVNTIGAIPMPQGCEPVPVDIPAMPNAQAINRYSGWMLYQTSSSVSQVADFYFQQLGSLGWTTDTTKPTGDLKTPYGLTFRKGDEILTIMIDLADSGGLDITILMFNPKDQAAISAREATSAPQVTATPSGPQPTIDPAKSGLPADVPLYPGATNLNSMGSQGVAFDAPDSSETVAVFYHQKMAAAGWSLMNETKSGTTFNQVWQKTARMVTLQIAMRDGKARVIVMSAKTG
jgi:hypothetical protein